MQEKRHLAQGNMENKNKEKKIIIWCIIAAVVLYILPTVAIFGFAYLDNMRYENQKYSIVDNKIYLEGLVISDINGTYYEDGHKYVITGSFENTDREELDLYFDLYDSEGYIIGEAISFLELKKNEKYKFKAIYEENDAKEVSTYKIKKVVCY